jgi:VWFA-related protein
MMYPKNLANPKHATHSLYVILFTAFVACAFCFVQVDAQQTSTTTPASKDQQRPRRVSNSNTAPTPATKTTPTAQPTPTPRATTAAQSSAGEDVDEGDVVRVETQLVSVPAVVSDRTGRPVTNLRAENFTLFEDNRLQRISNFTTTEAPFEVALLLDTSGSTREDVSLIRRAANAFIEALRPGDRVAIVAFNTARDAGSQLARVEVKTKLTSDRNVLRQAVENIGASNGTPFYDALERIASEVFRDAPSAELRGRRAVVALTDGVDSSSDADFPEVRARLLRAGVACYFIEVNTEDFVEDRLLRDCQDGGTLRLSRTQLQRYRKLFAPRLPSSDFESFCQLGSFQRMEISRDLYGLARREMDELAKSSGGKNFIADDLRAARNAFAQVANEIGTQYSLGYYPSNKTRDGRFRAIRVEVKGANANGAQVRAREGYYAPKG